MQHLLHKKYTFFYLLIFIIIGILLRFYNLDWGAPFYFHPDERNIASAVTQLRFPEQMNPHFFAYGSLPIYLIYFLGVIYNYLTLGHWALGIHHFNAITFETAILTSRIVAATLSVALIPLLFLIGKHLKNYSTGLLSAFLATTSIGFIQFAHFGTYEILLTFFTTLFFYTCLHLWEKPNKTKLLFTSIIAGLLLSTKVSSVVLLPLPILLLIAYTIKHHKLHNRWIKRLHTTLACLFYGIVILIIYQATNPFVINTNLTWSQIILNLHQHTFMQFFNPEFINSMNYESGVALGTLPVFYTGEFFNTLPVFYQIQHVLPFLLTPFLMIVLLPAFGYIIVKSYKDKHYTYFLLLLFLAITFFSQAFLFVKWIRYMLPTLPFFYLILAIFVYDGMQYLHNIVPQRKYKNILSLSLCLGGTICLLYAIIFVDVVYIRDNTIFSAVSFAQKNIPSDANILSEVYDLGITPFNPHFSKISLFNFYDLDNNSPDATEDLLKQNLENNEYIILPSQRILKMRLQKAKKFPIGNKFYKQLLAGQLNYKKIYETPCDILCKITYAGNPINSYEETANVFDRPVVMIFKKE